jgi:hypothetical protein
MAWHGMAWHGMAWQNNFMLLKSADDKTKRLELLEDLQ